VGAEGDEAGGHALMICLAMGGASRLSAASNSSPKAFRSSFPLGQTRALSARLAPSRPDSRSTHPRGGRPPHVKVPHVKAPQTTVEAQQAICAAGRSQQNGPRLTAASAPQRGPGRGAAWRTLWGRSR